MAPLSLPIFLLHFSFIIILTFTSPITAGGGGNNPHSQPKDLVNNPHSQPKDLVKTSCAHATYPNICLRTLSSYSNQTNNPNDLAKAAVKISLIRTRKTSDYMAQLKSQSQSKREKYPLSDCVEQIGDSIDELSKTLTELQHLHDGGEGGGIFRWRMSNAETWVSAALTNEYTCLDGFKEIYGNVRSDVKKKITNVARVTSNALYLINRL